MQFQTLDGMVQAIESVSLDIHNGETVAVVGESGSGKSVTSLSILKLHQDAITNYVSGTIHFSEEDKPGTNLLTLTEKALQKIRGNRISMIFQEPMTSLNPVMQCGLQITEAIMQHKKLSFAIAKQQTLDLFREVQIPDPEQSFKKYPSELSGGQKQRVMIAMAMCCKPSLLICDEPTTALDVTVQKNIIHLIKRLQEQNRMGVLFISHDLGLVSEIADTIVVMYKGKVVEKGPAKELLKNPAHPYTKALLACRPSLYPKGTRLPVVADFLQVDSEIKLKTQVVKPVELSGLHLLKQEILRVENLTVRFPTKRNLFGKITSGFTAVNNVSFHITAGETIGLVGESGCGKTTIGRAIVGLNKPTRGKIFYQNEETAGLNAKKLLDFRKEVQIVFQDPYSSLNPRKTIGHAIMEPMLLHHLVPNKKIGKDAVTDLLEKVELLPEHFMRYPHEFSGGQRQRIVIARALALGPKLLVCDESVSALDVSVQAQILNLINDLKKQFGFTVLFISHDLAVVKYISDRIIVMQKGIIVETNIADALFKYPRHAYTKSLIEAIPGKVAV